MRFGEGKRRIELERNKNRILIILTIISCSGGFREDILRGITTKVRKLRKRGKQLPSVEGKKRKENRFIKKRIYGQILGLVGSCWRNILL